MKLFGTTKSLFNKSLLVILAGSAIIASGCQKDGGGTAPAPATPPYYGYNNYGPGYNNGGYATTPQPCSFNQFYPNQSTCQQYYNQFNNYYPNWANQYANYQWSYGAWYWPTQVSYQTGYCGCPSGYTPVHGASFGISCAPNAYFNNWNVVWMNVGFYGGAAQNQHWLNNPQVYYSGNGNNPGCGQVAQGCDVRINNCSSGYTCRPVAGGSTIGLCAL